MSFRKIMGTTIATLMIALLTSCNIGKAPEPTLDANAIYTSAAQTMSAGVRAHETETAAAATPTLAASPAPLASVAPLPTFAIATSSAPFGLSTLAVGVTSLPAGTAVSAASGCNNAAYVTETGPVDKSSITAGKTFIKTFTMNNTGTCSWTAGYSFSFVSGDQLGGNSVTYSAKDAATDPGHTNVFKLTLTAPTAAGEYIGHWQMETPDGKRFGDRPYFDIIVP
jgi:hypothetical protein